MKSPTILMHDRPVTTPFGMLGKDENALSFALGYTFAKCPRLLQHFLRHIGLGGLRGNSLNEVEITLQRHDHIGITDIEISLPGKLFVVIEAKVGLSLPTLDQCVKYLPRFEQHKAVRQRLVALVASPATSMLDRYKSQNPELKRLLTAFRWLDLIPDCIRMLQEYPATTEPGLWIRAFQQFLEQEYTMRAFTEEVWIVPTGSEPWKHGGPSPHDFQSRHRVYWRDEYAGKRPLYIAFRNERKVTAIQRVISVEHEVAPSSRFPELKRWKVRNHDQPMTMWYLGETTLLPNLLKTGVGVRDRSSSCDLDLLLTSKKVREAEKRMKERYRKNTHSR